MNNFNLFSELLSTKNIQKDAVKKVLFALILVLTKYLMLVYLFDLVLKCITNSNNYLEFFLVVLANIICVIIRIVVQNVTSFYLNDKLKLSLECFLGTRLYECFRNELLNERNIKENEYNLNFVKEKSYDVIDNVSLIISNFFLLIMTLIYVAKFSFLYLLIALFPITGLLLNIVIAKLEIKIYENESGIFYVLREMKKITNNFKVINYFCNFSLFNAFSKFKNKEFSDSLIKNRKYRKKISILCFGASLIKICAVFFIAVIISIRLIEQNVIKTIDIVVIINACNMMAAAISNIINKLMINKELIKHINKIFNSYYKHKTVVINNFYSLKFENITFKYKKSNTIFKYNLTIKKGDKKVIIGNNGGGKTTLLRLILGYVKPDSGNVFINGEAITDNFYLGTAIGIFEPYPILNIPVYKYILSNSENAKLSQEHIEILKKLGINIFDNINLDSKLSSGTYQAINIIRAIYSPYELIILDEPTSKLNSKLAILLIKEILEKKDTVIISTHDKRIISMFDSKNVIFLDKQDTYCR